MSKDTIDIILVFVLLLTAAMVFIRIAVKVRRGGGSMTTLMHGAVDGFYNKDKNNPPVRALIQIKFHKEFYLQ